MRISILSEHDLDLWNAIVDASQHGTIFHRWEWLKIVEKHSQSKLYPLIGFEGNEPVGILPLFYSRRWLLRMVFSPPIGAAIPTLGPILVNYDEIKPHKMEHIYREFQKQVDHFINSELHPDYVSITTSPGLLDIRPFIWSGYRVTPYYTYKIDLTTGEAAVWDSFNRVLRKDIRHAEKNGLSVVQRVSHEDIEYVYESLNQRYQAQKMKPPVLKQYLYDMFEQFGSSYLKICVVLHKGKPVGAFICTTYKDTLCTWIGGVGSSGIGSLEANGLLHWETIRWAIRNGYKTYDLVGANTRNICESKSKFSPELDLGFTIRKTGLTGKLAERLYLLLYKRRWQ